MTTRKITRAQNQRRPHGLMWVMRRMHSARRTDAPGNVVETEYDAAGRTVGVGGLLYLTVSNSSTPNSSTQQLYIPCYDNNGNVTRYLDANGNAVAQYTYDAFGKLIAKSGPLADFFRYRFSTKYFDTGTGLYYYDLLAFFDLQESIQPTPDFSNPG